MKGCCRVRVVVDRCAGLGGGHLLATALHEGLATALHEGLATAAGTEGWSMLKVNCMR